MDFSIFLFLNEAYSLITAQFPAVEFWFMPLSRIRFSALDLYGFSPFLFALFV